MSLSATRSRRANAGNRWAEALAAVQLENGDAADPDAEAPGEEFIGKEEEDIFESDFESTDEDEYAKQGVEDGEKQVQMEEKAERRAARAKASKSGAAPTQKILERAMRGQPAPKRKRSSMAKSTIDRKPSILWDATRQSERASTVKHKFQVQERLKDAEKRKAHAPRRPRPVVVPKTQDELIAAALELEEKNTKALGEFLEKEEEKRAAARRVVRLKIEGPVVRWVSRGEIPLVEEVEPGRGASGTVPGLSQAQFQAPAAQAPVVQALTQPTVGQASAVPSPTTQPPVTRVVPPLVGPTSPLIVPENTGTTILTPTPTPVSVSTSAPARASTPIRTQRMQVYVEIPTPSKSMRRSLSSSSTQGPSVPRGRESSPSFSVTRGLSAPSSQPLVRSPLSSTVSLPRSPLSTSAPLVPESGDSQPLVQPPKFESSLPSVPTLSNASGSISSQRPEPTHPIASQADPLHTPHRPVTVRQSSMSSSTSGKSKGKMVMYVEIPVRKKIRGGSPAPGPVETSGPSSGGLLLEPSSVPPVSVSPVPPTPSVLELTTSPSLPTLPTPAPCSLAEPMAMPYVPPKPAAFSPPRKQTRNYVIVEYGGGARASFGWNMQAVFGNHADWEDVLIHGVKPLHPMKPVCAITGLPAPYRDSRTGIPYANAYAYKTLTRLLAHEFVWSKERGCYIGDEGKDPARSVPPGWKSAAAGPF